jgi:hypothetical protein
MSHYSKRRNLRIPGYDYTQLEFQAVRLAAVPVGPYIRHRHEAPRAGREDIIRAKEHFMAEKRVIVTTEMATLFV